MALVDQIGESAGIVWHLLKSKGPMSMAKLVSESKQPRDLVMLGLGWLAREEKIWVEQESRKRVVSLR